MMKAMKVDFEELPWQSPAPGVREKAVRRGPQRLRLLEFAAGFEEREWCRSAHAFSVPRGARGRLTAMAHAEVLVVNTCSVTSPPFV